MNQGTGDIDLGTHTYYVKAVFNADPDFNSGYSNRELVSITKTDPIDDLAWDETIQSLAEWTAVGNEDFYTINMFPAEGSEGDIISSNTGNLYYNVINIPALVSPTEPNEYNLSVSTWDYNFFYVRPSERSNVITYTILKKWNTNRFSVE